MGIVIIPNQVVRLRTTAEIDEDCECLGRSFSQLINKNDDSMFQLNSSNEVTNGDFESSLDDWDVYTAITGTAAITNESEAEECDGEVVITASGGTAPYTYSINGGVFGASNNFTGLCSGEHLVTIKDSLNHLGTVEFSVVTNIDCSLYAGSDAFDLLELGAAETLNCFAFSFT
jgi:hypothetical protein